MTLAILYMVIFASHLRHFVKEVRAAREIKCPRERIMKLAECVGMYISYLVISLVYAASHMLHLH